METEREECGDSGYQVVGPRALGDLDGVFLPFFLGEGVPAVPGARKPGSETKEDFHLTRCRNSGGVCAKNVPSRYPFG